MDDMYSIIQGMLENLAGFKRTNGPLKWCKKDDPDVTITIRNFTAKGVQLTMCIPKRGGGVGLTFVDIKYDPEKFGIEFYKYLRESLASVRA